MLYEVITGTTEVAVISLGGIVTAQSVRVAGDELDDAIIQYVKKEYSLAIGDRTAEEIKIQMGSAWPMEDELTADIRGRDLVSGLPRTIQLTTEHVREALAEPVGAIVDAVKTVITSYSIHYTKLYELWLGGRWDDEGSLVSGDDGVVTADHVTPGGRVPAGSRDHSERLRRHD